MNLRKILFLLFLLVGCSLQAIAQPQDSVKVDISSQIDVRLPSESIIEAMRMTLTLNIQVHQKTRILSAIGSLII